MAYSTDHALEVAAADTLHVEIVPGTEIMRDVGDIHFAHASGSADGIVLIPHPSNDPLDPLNWSKTWKAITIVNQAVFTFTSVISVLSVAPMYPLLGAEFDLTEAQIGLLTGVVVIVAGLANFIIVPCSNIFGRRPTSLVFATLVVAISIWTASAKSYKSLLASRALIGLASSTNESLMMQVVADLFFLHERGFWSGIYFTSYFMGLFLGPIISGPMSRDYGWRSFFWLATALGAFNLIFIFFAFPETKFHPEFPGLNNTVDKSSNEKDQASEIENSVPSDPTIQPQASSVGKGRPSKRNFVIFQRPDKKWKQFLIRDITIPVRAFCYPIIFWAGLMVAGPANLLLLWNETESSLLRNAPYYWNPSQVGFANFSFAIGGLLGLAIAGPFSDWVAQRATKRNNGVREAEMRLPALIPFVLIVAVAAIVGGLGNAQKWDWPIILVFGYGFTGLAVTSLPTIAVAYAIDSYKPISGEIMVVATVIKNTCGFGQSYWVVPEIQRAGFMTVAMIHFSLIMGPAFLGIGVYFWGKKLRRATKDSKMHALDEIF